MKTRQLFAFTILCLPLLASAIDGLDILKKVDRNLEPESYESYRKLVNIEPDGKKKEFVIYSAKKGKDQMATLFLSPTTDKGRTTLRQGDNMWLYIPNVGKPVRITSLQAKPAIADAILVQSTARYNDGSDAPSVELDAYDAIILLKK